MKAITYRTFGPAAVALRLEEVPTPVPAAGEVVVDVVFSGVNPSDVKARAGARAGMDKLPWPAIIPHSDGAGVISSVGEGVDPARVGERVWIWNGQWQRAFGTAAEQIALPSQQAVSLPDTVPFEVGAVLGIPGLTACHAVFSGGPVDGKTVLVQGGAGMVGILAVQLAKWGNARVIATCSEKDKERVLAAGADAVLDYSSVDLAAEILAATAGQHVDHIVEVEFGANADVDAAVIAENGRITAYGSAKAMRPELPFYALMFKSVTLEMALIYLLSPCDRRRAEDLLTQALMANALQFAPPQIYAMEAAADAHIAVEGGLRKGAVLIRTAAD